WMSLSPRARRSVGMAITSMVVVSGYRPSGWPALAQEPLRARRLSARVRSGSGWPPPAPARATSRHGSRRVAPANCMLHLAPLAAGPGVGPRSWPAGSLPRRTTLVEVVGALVVVDRVVVAGADRVVTVSP